MNYRTSPGAVVIVFSIVSCLLPSSSYGQLATPGTHSAALSTLPWVSYLGGLAADRLLGVTTDSSGNVYVCGWTNSTNYPVSPGAWQGSYAGGTDAIVAKYSPAGVRLWSTYFGGSLRDEAVAIAVDSTGRVYVFGGTASTDLPVTSGAVQSAYGGGSFDSFLACFSATGSLLWSTYFGGSNTEYGLGIAAGPNNRVAVSGYTKSTNFPTTPGAHQTAHGGEDDGFVAVFSGAGTVQWCTLLGRTSWDDGRATAIDRAGNTYLVGETQGDFPVTAGAHQSTLGGRTDGFIASFSPAGALRLATYLGGSGQDAVYAISTDSLGNAYVVGYTSSTDFPVTQGAAQIVFGGSYDASIASYSPQGAVRWASYFGGMSDDRAYGIGMDRRGLLHVGGSSASDPFPTTPDAQQPSLNFTRDGFFLRITDGGALVYSTLIGGNRTDEVYAVACDSAGFSLLVGNTVSDSSLAMAQASQQQYGGGSSDGFIARVHPQGYWPVVLQYFTAERSSDGVHLCWSTAEEQRNAGFEVQRSTDGSTWRVLAFISGGGSSGARDYCYTDSAAAQQQPGRLLLYRLKQMDFDGTATFSPVVEVWEGGAGVVPLLLAPWPNPVRGELYVPIIGDGHTSVSILVHDVFGRILTRVDHSMPGARTLRLDASNWPAGLYIVHACSGQRSDVRTITVQ